MSLSNRFSVIRRNGVHLSNSIGISLANLLASRVVDNNQCFLSLMSCLLLHNNLLVEYHANDNGVSDYNRLMICSVAYYNKRIRACVHS